MRLGTSRRALPALTTLNWLSALMPISRRNAAGSVTCPLPQTLVMAMVFSKSLILSDIQNYTEFMAKNQIPSGAAGIKSVPIVGGLLGAWGGEGEGPRLHDPAHPRHPIRALCCIPPPDPGAFRADAGAGGR